MNSVNSSSASAVLQDEEYIENIHISAQDLENFSRYFSDMNDPIDLDLDNGNETSVAQMDQATKVSNL